MVRIGARLNENACMLTVVSHDYRFLGEHAVDVQNKITQKMWKDILNDYADEDVSWFFCEQNYLTSAYSWNMLFYGDARHMLSLVKDQQVMKVCRMVQVIHNAGTSNERVDVSFILALSEKLFDEKYIQSYGERRQLLLWMKDCC